MARPLGSVAHFNIGSSGEHSPRDVTGSLVKLHSVAGSLLLFFIFRTENVHIIFESNRLWKFGLDAFNEYD